MKEELEKILGELHVHNIDRNEAVNAIMELVDQQKKELVEKINKKYPPTFINEYEYGKAIMERGKQELTEIRRLSQEEKQILDDIINEIEG